MTLQREMETGVGEFCIRELFRIKIKLPLLGLIDDMKDCFF